MTERTYSDDGHELSRIIEAEAADQSWRDSAACRGLDPEMFLAERGESTAPARAVCATCPVREACLEYALAAGMRFGVWGGLSERERRRMRAARRRGAAA